MAEWASTKASRVLAALLRIGWRVVRQRGSHKILNRDGWQPYTWAFHEGEDIGPRMLARIAKHTGLPRATCSVLTCRPPATRVAAE